MLPYFTEAFLNICPACLTLFQGQRQAVGYDRVLENTDSMERTRFCSFLAFYLEKINDQNKVV
jgi:hypothetical protein